MARYKHYDYAQTKLLPVAFERQILPGTFEYTLNRVIDERIDLSIFEARYANDEVGALSANISETPAFLEISVEGVGDEDGTDRHDGRAAGGGCGRNAGSP